MTSQKLNQRVGILGGGQLGKMLMEAGSKMCLDLHTMDNDNEAPCAKIYKNFTLGSIKDEKDVLAFAKDKDIITIEIENVNIEALETLHNQGKKVFPQPSVLKIITDKGLQKQFYKEQNIPTSPFVLLDNRSAVLEEIILGNIKIPFVQKSRKDGYDGKGVHVVRSEADLAQLMDVPCVIETLVDINKELAVIVVRKANGEVVTFPLVEMQFHATANLVEFLFSPSSVTPEVAALADQISRNVASSLGVVGLLAVELFLDNTGNVLVNEVAPRPHNSGHHTIEGCDFSQYDMHLRAIMDLPIPSPQLKSPAVMINLLGEDSYTGNAIYEGVDQVLNIPEVYINLYGKSITKPFRKMGHVTILAPTLAEAKSKAYIIQQTLKVIA